MATLLWFKIDWLTFIFQLHIFLLLLLFGLKKTHQPNPKSMQRGVKYLGISWLESATPEKKGAQHWRPHFHFSASAISVWVLFGHTLKKGHTLKNPTERPHLLMTHFAVLRHALLAKFFNIWGRVWPKNNSTLSHQLLLLRFLWECASICSTSKNLIIFLAAPKKGPTPLTTSKTEKVHNGNSGLE